MAGTAWMPTVPVAHWITRYVMGGHRRRTVPHMRTARSLTSGLWSLCEDDAVNARAEIEESHTTG